ncbi:C40 family peptidase [Paenibacillus eucommiae]|uniref:Cell wall-associated NlpC family hydrolase n=1 Tax=Paenibacillus eucommiae TaxID=1355755 RepID=A0ABS4JAC1_9BACL|nr:SH3 domain-containing C40 family peptidase [Paenibacillus eucommiae]MBP1996785.1 cell wall-associated NlpC family hydrolase [Paenibacillus eucommiae]
MKSKWLALFLVPAISLGAATLPQQSFAASTITSAQVVSAVNFRDKPSVNSTSMRFLQKGEKVTVIEKVNDYWYKIKDKNGKTGYVSTSSKYISTVSDNNNSNNGSSGNNLTASAKAQKVIAAGKKYMGTPYEFGSSRLNTKTFDCSDFVRQAFKDGINVTLPSNSRTQADYVKAIGKTTTNWKNLKVGDLLFFMDYKGLKASDYAGINKSKQRISHVGIYLGNGQMLHTYSIASGGVRIDSIDNKHWEYRFVIGGTAIK